MPVKFPEETLRLDEIMGKLQSSLQELDLRVKAYADEYKESMKYLAENKSDMDGMEIFSNETSISRMVSSGSVLVERKTKIEKLLDSPYFARIDFKMADEVEADPYYIGRFSFADDDGNMLIYDWRAPISSMYYDFELGPAFYEAPAGKIEGEIMRKRQFKIKSGRMQYVLESSISIIDEVLQKELSHNSDQRMKNIVATIQKEQNKIIRNENANVLVIQGAAGSGKTSIALHRAAYFLYKYKDRLSSQNIAIISPNKVFADYVSNVLPELGEEPITEVGFEDIASEQLKNVLEFEKFAEQLEEQLEQNDEKRMERIKFKSSMAFLSLLDEYLEHVSEQYFHPIDCTFGDISISKDFIQKRYHAYKKHPILQRFAKIAEDIIEKIKKESMSKRKAPTKVAVKKKLISMFKVHSTLALYTHFYTFINRPGMFVFKGKNKLENADVFPYIYVKLFFEGIHRPYGIKHVIIDEMQDYTPVQYAVIKHLYNCRKTILGDFNQTVNPYNSNSLQSFSALFENVEYVELNKSYRSTHEIITFAKKIQHSNIDPVERHGQEPQMIQCKDFDSEMEAIGKVLDGFKKSHFSTLGIICKTKRQAKKLHDELCKKHDIHFLDFNSDKFSNGITITTIHLAKGLEFDEVVIPFVSSEVYQTEYDRSLIYIACTRAMHKLTLTCHGEMSNILPN
ncbi:MAG TPA: 3'-5' exonuclease [Bacillus sp. (in: firmicutes)]|nr:3'-5' exonuclease [Bacillus sp. (in: firmicutes)]